MSRLEINSLNDHHVEYLYHMTHIENLPSILEHGLLAHGNLYQKEDISNREVNDRRSLRDPIYGKRIHDYVPFYFSPRNAMLYALREMQNNIVILEIKREVILADGTLFTDGNASSGGTSFSNDLSELDMIDWKCINAKYWLDFSDGRRKKMAEVLVPNFVSIDDIEVILCNNHNLKSVVDLLTKENIESFVDRSFYF